MNVTITRKETKQAGGCNGCSYPDGEQGTVFEIGVDNLTIRLCRRCLNELKQGIEWLDPKTRNTTNWRRL